MASNLQQLDYLYARIALVEIIERSENCALTWVQTEPSVFQAEWTFGSIQYDLNLIRLPGYYVLDFVRDEQPVLSINSLNEEAVWELVRLVDNPDSPIKESIRSLRSQRGCDAIFNEHGRGGIKAGGRSRVSHVINIAQLTGGIEVAGESPNKSGFFATGGAVMAGVAEHHENMHETARGGVVTKGGAELPLLFAMGFRSGSPIGFTALYSFDTSGSQLKKLTEAAYSQFGALDMWDVDYVNGKLYTASNGNVGITGHIRDLDYSNPQQLFVLPGTSAGGLMKTCMRYDRFDNLLWFNFDRNGYRYTFSGNPVVFHVDSTFTPEEILVFPDAVYSLYGGNIIYRFSKSGTLISSVNLSSQGVLAVCMAEDYTNDLIWIGGQLGPINNNGSDNFIASLSKDLTNFSIKYTHVGPSYRTTGIVIDNRGDSVWGYALNPVLFGLESGHVQINQFKTDGSGTVLAGSIYQPAGEPSGTGMRIWQKI